VTRWDREVLDLYRKTDEDCLDGMNLFVCAAIAKYCSMDAKVATQLGRRRMHRVSEWSRTVLFTQRSRSHHYVQKSHLIRVAIIVIQSLILLKVVDSFAV